MDDEDGKQSKLKLFFMERGGVAEGISSCTPKSFTLLVIILLLPLKVEQVLEL